MLVVNEREETLSGSLLADRKPLAGCPKTVVRSPNKALTVWNPVFRSTAPDYRLVPEL